MDPKVAKSIALFSALSEEDLRALLATAERVPFKKDEELLEQGKHNASLYVVTEGVLHIRRRAQGHDVLLGRLEPGGFFGEVSLFDPGPTTAAVHAVTDGVAIRLLRPQIDQFVADHPHAAAQILIAILTEMSKRMRRVDEKLVDSIVWGGLLK